jgi:uncharacterized protein (DUF58 family)
VTARGRLTLALGLATYAVAWLLGVRALYPVGVGLAGAAFVAALWVRLAARPERVTRRPAGDRRLEGDDVRIDLRAELGRGVRPAALVVTERLGRLGIHHVRLGVDGREAHGQYRLARVARGRYLFEDARVAVEDPFGLARAESGLAEGGALLVHPRLVELGSLFTETGSEGHAGRRLLLRRPTGFELHGVREYQQGESLRRVHWPSTAKRGALMVKDLEDAPRDALAIVLDAREGAAVGPSFDVQVRAAGSLLRAYGSRGRRALLAINGAAPSYQRVESEGDWLAAYDALAAVEPAPARSLAALLIADASPVSRAAEILAVVAAVPRDLVDRLVQRAASGHRTGLVLVDAPSFAGRPSSPSPELLRLSAAGVAVTVVRSGEDLAGALSGAGRAVAARA